MDPVAQTSRWTAAARARESARPDRIFDDPFAERLATPAGFEILERMGVVDGGNPFIAVRTRFLDEFLVRSVAARTQVVMLAAGVDARPYRLAWPEGVTWFELDRAEVLAAKREVLAGETPRCARRDVPVDLLADWTVALKDAGFDPSAPSVWVAEGLVVYQTEDEARAVLSRAASVAATGSQLAFDLPGTSLLTSELMKEPMKKLEAMGAPWRLGTNDPEGFVASCGWSTTAISRPGEPGVSYGRWPWTAAPRGTPGVPESFFVVAARA